MADKIVHQSQPLTFDLTTSPAYKAGVADGYQRGLADAAKVCEERAKSALDLSKNMEEAAKGGDDVGLADRYRTEAACCAHNAKSIRALADKPDK